MGDVDSTATAGLTIRGYRRGTTSTDEWDQYVVPVRDRIVSYDGRVGSLITPGRGTVGQKILSLENKTGSGVVVAVQRIKVDLLTTVAKAVTVVPPVVQIVRFTPAASGGTVITKAGLDASQTSDANVVVTGDASAHGTSSGTALTLTAGAVITQAYAPRCLTAVGYEPIDIAEFFTDVELILRANQGMAVFLDQAVVTTGNPSTDRWIATAAWQEFTRP